MYAKIITKNKTVYYSPILYIRFYERKNSVVIFDESFTKLIVKEYEIDNPTILFIDFDTKDYLINNYKIISIWDKNYELNRCRIGRFTRNQINKARMFIKNVSSNFTSITSQEDFRALQENTCSLYDLEIKYENKIGKNKDFVLSSDADIITIIRLSGKIKDNIVLDEVIDNLMFSIVNNQYRLSIEWGLYEYEGFLSANQISFASYFKVIIPIKEINNYKIDGEYIYLSGINKNGIQNFYLPIKNVSYDQMLSSFFFQCGDVVYQIEVLNWNLQMNQLLEEMKETKKFENLFLWEE